jgi:hypothetical protein
MTRGPKPIPGMSHSRLVGGGTQRDTPKISVSHSSRVGPSLTVRFLESGFFPVDPGTMEGRRREQG